MRLHIWSDDKPPRFIRPDDCDLTIIDYPHWNGFEVGDQIQFLTDLGTSVYFVIDIEPTWDGMREMRIVTLQESGWTTKAGH
jgi:hypothetical protein